MIKYFIAGIVTKLLASFDDTVTRIPVIAQVTYTRKGKIAKFKYLKETAALGLFILALVVYFGLL